MVCADVLGVAVIVTLYGCGRAPELAPGEPEPMGGSVVVVDVVAATPVLLTPWPTLVESRNTKANTNARSANSRLARAPAPKGSVYPLLTSSVHFWSCSLMC